MEALALANVTVDRDDHGRIVRVAGDAPDGRQLEFALDTSISESDVETRGVFLVDGASVLELIATVDHSSPEPWMTLRAITGDEVHYQVAATVRKSDGSVSVEGSASGVPFNADAQPGEDLPDDLPDLDAALPAEVRNTIEPLAPFVAMVGASAGQPVSPRKKWWRRIAGYGCFAAAGAGIAALCGATAGVGCIAGAAVISVAGAYCADVAHG